MPAGPCLPGIQSCPQVHGDRLRNGIETDDPEPSAVDIETIVTAPNMRALINRHVTAASDDELRVGVGGHQVARSGFDSDSICLVADAVRRGDAVSGERADRDIVHDDVNAAIAMNRVTTVVVPQHDLVTDREVGNLAAVRDGQGDSNGLRKRRDTSQRNRGTAVAPTDGSERSVVEVEVPFVAIWQAVGVVAHQTDHLGP